MKTKEEIEGFLDKLSVEGASHREVEQGLWIVKPGGAIDFDVVVNYSPPVVVLRVKVMDLPSDKADIAKLSRRLLELNATDLLHGSYGIEQNAIVLTEALELVHLDYEEFLAAYESMTLALASHLREIGTLGTGEHRVPASNGKKNGKTIRKTIKAKKSAKPKKAAKKAARSAKRGRR